MLACTKALYIDFHAEDLARIPEKNLRYENCSKRHQNLIKNRTHCREWNFSILCVAAPSMACTERVTGELHLTSTRAVCDTPFVNSLHTYN